MATSEKAVMMVGVDESEQSIYVLEWALDHFFAPHAPNFHFDLVIVCAKPSPISVVGIGGPGSCQALPYVDADLKKIAARVIEQAKELCISKSRGTEIWRMENLQPVPLPKSDHGKFYSGDSYIVLQTSPGRGSAYLYDIHFWLGKDTSQDEGGTAAIKTVELGAILGGRAVQHRELQGHESDKFPSYFKPCIVPLEGGVASRFKKPEEEVFEMRLYVCKGK